MTQNPVPARLTAALADRYRIERELGAGGMATVYLAEDLKHKRKVAVKVLRPELAAVLGAERFVQEITTTASLQHPHILPLFDSGEADGFLYYVMPYIDGETLRDKLNRETQLSIDEAVQITTDVAEALEAAHEEGVIHRDIKPENILLHKGRAMVADFGIALAVSAAAGGRMTETGLSLGTPHYMSPEQATAEKDLTKRSDVYSLGTVLYEMLTGEPPHMGNSAQQIIMKIVTDTPRPVTELRKSVPPHVAAAVALSLEKLAADRFDGAKAFADALADVHFGERDAAVAAERTRGTSRLVWGSAVAVAAVAGFVAAWIIRGSPVAPGNASPVLWLAVPGDSSIHPLVGWGSNILADGSGRAIIADGPEGRGIYLQSFSGAPTRYLPAPDAAVGGKSLADGTGVLYYTFLSSGLSRLRVAPVNGAPPRTLTDSVRLPVAVDDRGRVYGTHHADRVLARVDPRSQQVERLTELDSARGETLHMYPVLLSGGRGIIFTIQSADSISADAVRWEIAVLDVEQHAVTRLFDGQNTEPLPNGYLLFGDRAGTLNAVRFDTVRMTPEGDPVPVLQGVAGGLLPARNFNVSRNGTLLYQPAAAGGWEILRLAPGGAESFVRGDGPAPRGFRLHPDGRRVAEIESGALVFRSADGASRRVSLDAVRAVIGSWSPDGDRIAFLAGNPTGPGGVAFSAPLDGATAPVRLALPPDAVGASGADWGRSGIAVAGAWLPTGSQTAIAMDERMVGPRLSPEGRYLAYQHGFGEAAQVVVRAVPPGTGRWEVAFGASPRWSPDGKFLYFASPGLLYQSAPASVLRVPVLPGPSFSWGSVTVVAEVPPRATTAWEIGPRDGLVYWMTRAEDSPAILVSNWARVVDSLVRGASSR